MLPLRLKIHGYRSYLDAEINFAEYGSIVAITGENGAGKSSIIDMITTALYYRNSCTDDRGAGMDEVINAGCDGFQLEFDFQMNEHFYTVITSKKRGGSRELRFLIDNEDVSGKIADTQAKINEVLRLTYDTFMDTVCIGQGQSSRFMDKTPNERRAVFTQLLDLRRYEAYEKMTKDMRKNVKDKFALYKTKVTTLESQQVADIDSLKDEITKQEAAKVELNKRLVDAKETLQAELKAKATYEQMIKYTNTILTARKQLTDQVKKLEAEKEQLQQTYDKAKAVAPAIVDQKEVDDLYDKAIQATDAERKLYEHIAAGKAKRDTLKTQAEQIQAKIYQAQQLGEGTCPTCGAAITPQSKDRHIHSLVDNVEELKQRIKRINEKLEQVQMQADNAVQNKRKADADYQHILAVQRAAEAAHSKLQQISQSISMNKTRLDEVQTQLTDNLSMQVDEIEKREFVDAILIENVKNIEMQISKCSSAIAVANERINQAQKIAEELVKIKKEEAKTKQLYTDLDAVASAFSKTGIQARILANDLPAIEREINEVITTLCDGELSIAFVTQDTVGKGKDKHQVETMDIEVRDAYGARRYFSYSGGERFRIDFACHVGLARYLTRRAGATMDFFIVDEGLGSQDDAARQRFTEMLHRMGKFFKQIMVITHISEVQDAFDCRVLVQKDPVKGSRLRVFSK